MPQFMDHDGVLGQGRFTFAQNWDLDEVAVPAPNVQSLLQKMHAFEARVEQGMRLAVAALKDLAAKQHAIAAEVETVKMGVQQRSVVDDEVRRYREDEFKNTILGPLLRNLASILDRTDQDSDRAKSLQVDAGLANHPQVTNALKWVVDARELDRVDIFNVFAAFEVEPFRSARGQRFDTTRHAYVDKRYADDARLANCIARSLRPGYIRRRDDWVVRREEVLVYVMK